MKVQDAHGGYCRMHDYEVADLRERVNLGLIDPSEAALGPLVNPLDLNRAKRRKKRVKPPEQINMASIWERPQ